MSLKTIAELTGLSMNTVSRALRGKGYIAPDTKAKVEAAAREVGYRPNRAARSLRGGKGYEIAVISFFSENSRHGDALQLDRMIGVKQRLALDDYEVLPIFLFREERFFNRNLQTLKRLASSRPAGAVWFEETMALEHYAAVAAGFDFPVVRIAPEPDRAGDCVSLDRAQGVADAVEFLYRKGCRRIAMAMAGEGHVTGFGRLSGYCRAVAGLGLPEWIIRTVHYAEDPYEEGRSLGFELARAAVRPDGIVAYSDYLAAGMLAALNASGVKVPDELQLVGFDDRELAGFTAPPLTTLAQPSYELGRAAAELLLRRLNDPGAPAECRSVRMNLMERNSTKGTT